MTMRSLHGERNGLRKVLDLELIIEGRVSGFIAERVLSGLQPHTTTAYSLRVQPDVVLNSCRVTLR